MSPDFDRDTALELVEHGHYQGQVSRGWWVGQGPNGGLLTALALRAATLEVGAPERKPRSLTVHYLVRPSEGALDVLAAVERSGGRVTNVLIRFEQDSKPIALALAVFTTTSAGTHSFQHITAPDAPSPGSLESLPTHVEGMPEVMRNYEYRFALGQLPFTGASDLNTGIWVRTARPRRPDPIALAAFADAWTPVPFIAFDRPIPAPTLELTIHFRDHSWYERAADDAFVLAAFHSRLLTEGLFEEDGELWSEDGVLLAQSRQLAMLVT